MIQEEAKEQLLQLGEKLGYTRGWGENFISTYANSLYLYKCGFSLKNKSKGLIINLYWETNAPTSGNENDGFQANWVQDGKIVSTPFFKTTDKLYEAINDIFRVS